MIEDIKKTLWATADKLRANMDAAEYKHIVLGLIFVKYISDTFQTRRDELTARFGDPADDYFLHEVDAEMLADELEDRDYYKEVNVFWVPEAARWETLRAQAKQADIGKRIDDALSLIEAENPKLKGILDKRYARVQLPDGKLGELVDLVSTIGFGESGDTAKNHARDLLGQVYEYFLGQFASAEGKRGGQFGILDDDFLNEVRNLPERNLAVELLERLLEGEIKTRFATNVVQNNKFSEMLTNVIKRYQNRSIETAQVMEELIAMAKKFKEEAERGANARLNADELAFYDALADNEESVRELGDETLKKIAHELAESLRKNVSVDWAVRDSVRAKLRLSVKRILRKYKYPPVKEEAAVALVMQQAETLSAEWA